VSIRAIRVKLVGREYATIRDPIQTERSSCHYYHESCVFFKELVTLAGCMKYGNRQEPWTIEPGIYSYPFAFQLPLHGLPPSFYVECDDDDDYGGVFYEVKAYVDIPYGKNAISRAPFTVIRPLRLDQWMQPGPVTQDRYFDISMCCCVNKGKNATRFYMDRTLIAIDRDKLVVCADVDNTQCKEPVEAIVVSLQQCIHLSAHHMTESCKRSVGRVTVKQRIEAGARGRIVGTLELPHTETTPSAATRHVKSSYVVNIELDIPWASDPCHEFNVVVGQSVDETNTVAPLVWGESNLCVLSKGQLSSPEKFYSPPPMVVYPYVPVPNGCQQAGVALQTYEVFQVTPLGYPGSVWSSAAPAVMPSHEDQVAPPLGLQWSQGYDS
jgi:hypothetical protein